MFPYKKAMVGKVSKEIEAEEGKSELAERKKVGKQCSEEGEVSERVGKKPKGLEVIDDTMDDNMEDKGEQSGNEEALEKEGDNMECNGSSWKRGRKVVSYMDKVLCLNGDDNVHEEDEENWVTTQRREEEDDGMPDEVVGEEDDDPLCPTYTFSRRQHKEDCSKWRKTLIIKLMGKKLTSRFFITRLLRLWNLVGGYEVTDLDNGHLLFKFYEEKDYLHVLHEGSWIVADHYVIVQRWRPFFDPYNEEVKKLAVWLRIPGLPTEFYTTQHLWRIGNMLGRTLKVDKTSLRRTEGAEGEITDKARFARICVEVDLRRSFVSRFRMWDFVHREYVYLNVGYEGLHLICFACGKYGHRKDNCNGGMDYAKEPAKVEEVIHKEKEDEQQELGKERTVKEGEGSETAAFGAWMVVKRKTKVRKNTPGTSYPGKTTAREIPAKGKGHRGVPRKSVKQEN